ncbi:RraA family protein [Curtobacterium sp. MCLR17_007]|uniref:RraA family protein n=1 Tax=unclassified Curtobacterium TaxID=257496 RepID=UPI000DA74EDC|nr:RraA family protein [Curtobacterium sp. MCLR17_007]WIB60985.1 RraA family protein [Curtobacterium sp. MCLR17_007]
MGDAVIKSEAADARRVGLSAELTSADITDALGRLHGHRAHITGLVSPTPDRKLFGRVITISFFPSCAAALDPAHYNFGRLFHQAVAGAQTALENTVLVMASNGYTDTSLAGGTKLSRLANAGLAGVLTDGRLRDFGELADEPYAAWCSAEAIAWGGGDVTPYQTNVPVVIGGVGVHPGQYVFCDASGAVFIPESDIDRVLEDAHQIRRDDSSHRAAIALEEVGGIADGTER